MVRRPSPPLSDSAQGDDFDFEIIDDEGRANSTVPQSVSWSGKTRLIVGGVTVGALVMGLGIATRPNPPQPLALSIDDVVDGGGQTVVRNPDGLVMSGGQVLIYDGLRGPSRAAANASGVPADISRSTSPLDESARVVQRLTIRNDSSQYWGVEVIGLVGPELTAPVTGSEADPQSGGETGVREGGEVATSVGATPLCERWIHAPNRVSLAVRAVPLDADDRRAPAPQELRLPLPALASSEITAALSAVCGRFAAPGKLSVESCSASFSPPYQRLDWVAVVSDWAAAGLVGTGMATLPGMTPRADPTLVEPFAFDSRGRSQLSGSSTIADCSALLSALNEPLRVAVVQLGPPDQESLRLPASVIAEPAALGAIAKSVAPLCGSRVEAIAPVVTKTTVARGVGTNLAVTLTMQADPDLWAGRALAAPDPSTRELGSPYTFPVESPWPVTFEADGRASLTFTVRVDRCTPVTAPTLVIQRTAAPRLPVRVAAQAQPQIQRLLGCP